MLRQRGKRRRQLAAKAQAGCAAIPERTDLSERPEIVDRQERAGDWEGDTILGKGQQGAAVKLVERHSKYLYAKAVKHKTAALAGSPVTDLLQEVKELAERLRFDNGSEFAGRREIAAKLAHFATLRSVLSTTRKQGRNPLAVLLHAPPALQGLLGPGQLSDRSPGWRRGRLFTLGRVRSLSLSSDPARPSRRLHTSALPDPTVAGYLGSYRVRCMHRASAWLKSMRPFAELVLRDQALNIGSAAAAIPLVVDPQGYIRQRLEFVYHELGYGSQSLQTLILEAMQHF